MTGPLSSADRANLITDQREMEGGGGGGKVREERRGEGGEKRGAGAATPYRGLSLACQYQI